MGKWRFPTCSLVCQGAIWVPKYASINRLYHTLQMYLDFIRFMVSNCSKMYQNKNCNLSQLQSPQTLHHVLSKWLLQLSAPAWWSACAGAEGAEGMDGAWCMACSVGFCNKASRRQGAKVGMWRVDSQNVSNCQPFGGHLAVLHHPLYYGILYMYIPYVTKQRLMVDYLNNVSRIVQYLLHAYTLPILTIINL